MKRVAAIHFDLPFYLRLPSETSFSWDPVEGAAAIHPAQKVGHVAFCKMPFKSKVSSAFADPHRLLDHPETATGGHPQQCSYHMTCVTEAGDEYLTLQAHTGPEGGFEELRTYTELAVFLLISPDSTDESLRNRLERIVNNYLDIYRIITQDPYVRRITIDLDIYLWDMVLTGVPKEWTDIDPKKILRRINELEFPSEVGPDRKPRIRLNTLEDLHPGPVLSEEHRALFYRSIPSEYVLPLYYDLIFSAQHELKSRRYARAIIDAQTAFETYVSKLLSKLEVAIGGDPDRLRKEMRNHRVLGLLSQRLRRIDDYIVSYRKLKGLPMTGHFIGSPEYQKWKLALYNLRNGIVHQGTRDITFDAARDGTHAAKLAIAHLESLIEGCQEPVHIYWGVDHIKNTSGRLSF